MSKNETMLTQEQTGFLEAIRSANQGKVDRIQSDSSKYRHIKHEFGLINFGKGYWISDAYCGWEEEDLYFVQPDAFIPVIASLQEHNTASLDHKVLNVVRKYEWDSSYDYEDSYSHHISSGHVTGTISLDEQLIMTFALRYARSTPPVVIEQSQQKGREEAILQHTHYLEGKK